MPHAALWVVQHAKTVYIAEIEEVSMPHAALWVVQQALYAASERSDEVSMPHAALWVVQPMGIGWIFIVLGSFNAARDCFVSPPPLLRGPPPPLTQGRLFVYGMPASLPDARDAGCCKVPSQRVGATVF